MTVREGNGLRADFVKKVGQINDSLVNGSQSGYDPGADPKLGAEICHLKKKESGSSSIYREVNIHGKINTEIDEVDLANRIIYEDKTAGKLYMENADFPQTEQQWAFKHIYKKGSNRIDAINQSEYTLSIVGSENVPNINSLKSIRSYVFRIDADTPALRQAVEQCLVKLRAKYPEYNFSATYGGK